MMDIHIFEKWRWINLNFLRKIEQIQEENSKEFDFDFLGKKKVEINLFGNIFIYLLFNICIPNLLSPPPGYANGRDYQIFWRGPLADLVGRSTSFFTTACRTRQVRGRSSLTEV